MDGTVRQSQTDGCVRSCNGLYLHIMYGAYLHTSVLTRGNPILTRDNHERILTDYAIIRDLICAYSAWTLLIQIAYRNHHMLHCIFLLQMQIMMCVVAIGDSDRTRSAPRDVIYL